MPKWLDKFLCFIDCHHWSDPGGHCIKCGKCDEIFGLHKKCRMDKVIASPKSFAHE